MKVGARDQRDRVTLPDITSMVDVVFLLIIFFLTTSSLVRATVSEIDLPEQEGNIDARTEDGGLVVNISANGAYLVEGEVVGLTELLGMIEAEAGEAASIEDVEVLVRADQDARLAPVNRLGAGLVELGVRDWKLATRAPRGGAGSAGAANAGGDD